MINKCISCDQDLITEKLLKSISFKGINLEVEYETKICPSCGLEYATVEQTASLQVALAEAYKQQASKMTASEMKRYRKERKLTQANLANLMNVGIASIKRWEGGLIQSRSMDNLLKYHLLNENCYLDPLSGDRVFSIARANVYLWNLKTA